LHPPITPQLLADGQIIINKENQHRPQGVDSA
jgi:hypothetical protein